MKSVFCLFCIIFVIIFIFPASAKTIELKNGNIIVGEILREDAASVVVSKRGGTFVYSIWRSRIRKIRESTPNEIGDVGAQESIPDIPGAKETGEGEGSRSEKAKAYRLERYEKEVQSAKEARGRIKIKFSQNRFGVVDVLLNGKTTVPLLVDTGASLVMISKEAAKKLGIDYASIDEKINMVLADGKITTAIPIILETVTVGSSQVKDVKAAISSNPPGLNIDGLLGMSYLRYFDVKLDSDENFLILEKY
ncbi:MAG: retropepsin-like aspartic protease [Candidatus Omnitrophota bacterium]